MQIKNLTRTGYPLDEQSSQAIYHKFNPELGRETLLNS